MAWLAEPLVVIDQLNNIAANADAADAQERLNTIQQEISNAQSEVNALQQEVQVAQTQLNDVQRQIIEVKNAKPGGS